MSAKGATEQPLISIVTPSYNQGDFIEATIQSVLEQDYPYVEHIIVDDSSTDTTSAILKKYSHLRIINRARKMGQTSAIIDGFNVSTGSIITWLNSDDLYLPGAISKAVQAFALPERPNVVYGHIIHINAKGAKRGERHVTPFDLHEHINGHNCTIQQPASFYTRHAYEASGGLNQKYNYAMDYALWVTLATSGARFHMVDDYLAAFRFHDASKTVSQPKQFYKERLEITRQAGGYFFPEYAFDYWHDKNRLASIGLRKSVRTYRLLRSGNVREFAVRARLNVTRARP